MEFLFHEGISVVAVPLFFVISGATFFRNYQGCDYRKKLKSRIKSLAVPYFAWNILISLCYILIYTTPIRDVLGAENEFHLTPKYLFEAIVLHKRISAFWFIYNLMVFILLTPIFDFFLKKKWLAAIFALFLLSLPLYATEAIKPYGLWSIAPIYYFTGCIIGKYEFHRFAEERNTISPIAIIGTVLCIVTLMANAYDLIIIPVILRQLIVVSFTLFFWRLLDVLCHRIEERSYMNHNFIIYAIHPFIQALLVKAFVAVLPKAGWAAIIVWVTTAILTIVIIILLSEILKTKSPKLYSILSGGR